MRFGHFNQGLSDGESRCGPSLDDGRDRAIPGIASPENSLAWTRMAIGIAVMRLALGTSLAVPLNERPGVPVIRLENSAGEIVQAFPNKGTKAFVFLFVSVDCPICNAYAPEFRKLDADFSSAGISFRLEVACVCCLER